MDKPQKNNTQTLSSSDSISHIDSMPDELAMAINKAKALSNRSGIAWLLFQNNQLIASYSGFSGDPVFTSLEKPPNSLHPKQLYISSPPHPLAYTIAELITLVEHLPLDTICYPSLSQPLSKILNIEQRGIDGVNIIKPIIDARNESLFFGPATLKTHHRPWSTCFISMDIQGQGAQYNHFLSGFGAKSTFHELTKHTIVAAQQGLSYDDPKLRAIEEKCRALIIDDEKNLALLQKKLAKGGQSKLVILCSYSLFCKLANAHTVDECRIYVALTSLPSFHASYRKLESSTPILFDWKVISTQNFDTGILFQMRRNTNMHDVPQRRAIELI